MGWGGIGDGWGVGGGLEWVCGVGSQEAGAGCTDLSSKSWNKSHPTTCLAHRYSDVFRSSLFHHPSFLRDVIGSDQHIGMLSAPCFVSGVPLRACKHASSYYVHSPHRAQKVHIGKNISASFQSLGGGINPAGQNERSVDDFVSLCTCCE